MRGGGRGSGRGRGRGRGGQGQQHGKGPQQHGQQQHGQQSPQEFQMEMGQFAFVLSQALRDGNVYETHNLVDNVWNSMTERYFKSEPWPSVEVVAPQAQTPNDPVFSVLYKELYYRHIYAKLQPNVEQRFGSWANYCEFFDMVLSAGEAPGFELPTQWAYDIVDEFVYQFTNFCQFRCRAKKPEDIQLLKAHPDVWSIGTVIKYLTGLIERSRLAVKLAKKGDEEDGAEDDAEDDKVSNLHRTLGYFAIVGLARVHCLCGDYASVLKVLEPIDLTRKGLFSRVMACHSALYYYLGFSYLMMRRYPEAIQALTNVLFYLSRAQQATQTFQQIEINKKNDQMYSLLVIALTLSPQRIEEHVNAILKDKFGDIMQRLQKGDEALMSERFLHGCPKMILPAVPDYDDPEAMALAADQQHRQRQQLKIFLNDVRQQEVVPTIRSFLKLYTSIELSKLAKFLEVDEATLGEHLLCYKHKIRNRAATKWAASEVEFFIENGMVHVGDTKVQRRFGEYFIRNSKKLDAIITDGAR